MKLHLTTDYNFLQYNGKTRSVKSNAISKGLASRLLTEENCFEFFLANHIHHFMNHNVVSGFIGDFASKDSFSIWRKFQEDQNRRNYILENDLKSLRGQFKELADFQVAFSLLLNKKIAPLSLFILARKLKLNDKWSKSDDPLTQETSFFFNKASYFFNMDDDKFLQIINKIKSS